MQVSLYAAQTRLCEGHRGHILTSCNNILTTHFRPLVSLYSIKNRYYTKVRARRLSSHKKAKINVSGWIKNISILLKILNFVSFKQN